MMAPPMEVHPLAVPWQLSTAGTMILLSLTAQLPETYAMLLAGLGLIGFISGGERGIRTLGKAINPTLP